ncbi:MAG: two-component sensor histidine kinase [Herbaspirillum sp.]|jgi:two-component system OmpR family sensor kinase|nr:two-component sensor histidine kinase [Herbaspirillum sp.]
MDDFKRKMKQSLQFKLSVWLATFILAIALAAGLFSYFSAFDWALEFQDDQLRQVAALINRHDLPIEQAKMRQRVPGTDPDSELIVEVVPSAGGQPHSRLGNTLELPPDVVEGLQTVTVDTEVWRVYVKTLDSGTRIAVAQQTASRDEVAHDSAIRTLTPFIFSIPILLLLVGMLMRGTFMPIRQLASDIDQRSEHDLRAVSDKNLPSEIRPFLVAINRLLARVASSISAQRRFIADAAHELRSPMTALSLHAERLSSAAMSAPARERLDTLRTGVQRTRTLLEQLLVLAQAQESIAPDFAPISLWRTLRSVIEDLMPLAEAKDIDLGVTNQSDALVSAREIDLKMLIKNLVENAIRYTPNGGLINLSIHADRQRAILLVDDTGPGIPEQERARVFDPFYRILGSDTEGSGLGLSIVKTIAARIGATIALEDLDHHHAVSGLRVVVEFPVAEEASP